MTDFKIFIAGFTPFETSSFASFFRLASRRRIHYQIAESPAGAQLLLLNADSPALKQELAKKSLHHKVLLIGQSDRGTGLPLLARPYTLMSVLERLDKMLVPQFADTMPMSAMTAEQMSARVASHPLFSSPDYGVSSHVASTAPAKAQAAPPPKPAVVDMGSAQATKSTAQKPTLIDAEEEDSECDNILVVDDSDIALKFMQNRLYHFGYRAELAKSGEEALAMIAKRQYQYVFLDVMMQGMDGYQTCRAIKQRKYSTGYPPVVIMLTSKGGTIDKIRGTLAGCEAYLTKPIKEVDLIRALDIRNSKSGDTGSSGTSSTPHNTRILGSKKS